MDDLFDVVAGMESSLYPGKFVSVLLNDGSNSGVESLLFEEIGV